MNPTCLFLSIHPTPQIENERIMEHDAVGRIPSRSPPDQRATTMNTEILIRYALFPETYMVLCRIRVLLLLTLVAHRKPPPREAPHTRMPQLPARIRQTQVPFLIGTIQDWQPGFSSL